MMRFSFAILTAFLFIIILTPNVFALRINEIEPNPPGEDSKNEWVELFSEEEISLDGYYLQNSDGDIQNLTGIFDGFFIVNFSKRWILNNNETIYLKMGNELIEEVGPFNDVNNNDDSLSFCNGEWVVAPSTKGQENSCIEEVEEEKENVQQTNIEEQEEKESERDSNDRSNSFVEIKTENKSKTVQESEMKNKKIILQSSESKEITKTYRARNFVIYFFIGFCVFLVILIALKKL